MARRQSAPLNLPSPRARSAIDAVALTSKLAFQNSFGSLFLLLSPGSTLPGMTGNPYVSALKKCDIVMKGGITSGIVYPRAVTRLAKEYSFQSIGGTSAGAIAAAITAAAEYRRHKGTDVFAEMDKIPGWLGESAASGGGSNLFHLFQPQKTMAGLYRVASAFLGYSGWRLCLKLAAALGLDALLGALPGLAVIALLPGSHPVAGWVLGVLIGAVGLTLGAVTGIVLRAARLPNNHFGLCTGYVEPQPG